MTTSISIKNNFAELARLSDETERALETTGVSAQIIHVAHLCLEEIVTNIVKYGFTDGAEHLIEIGLSVENSELIISVTDEGREFDPLSAPEPDISAPIEEREIGGLGVHLVRKMMDEVNYQRDGNKNIFTMRKKVSPPENRP